MIFALFWISFYDSFVRQKLLSLVVGNVGINVIIEGVFMRRIRSDIICEIALHFTVVLPIFCVRKENYETKLHKSS